MNPRAIEWIRRHPIEAFFLLGIALCWGTLFPAVLVPQQRMFFQVLSFYLGRIGAYSPVLAGMFVARVMQPGRARVSPARRSLFFLPVWLIAVGILVANLRLTAPPAVSLLALIVLSMPAALLPAWVVTSAFSGSDGVRRMLATVIRPTGSAVYYMVALLTFPVLTVAGAAITNVLAGNAWLPQVSQGANLAFTLFITFFAVLLFSGGLNEESGWRGFAQRRLQARYSPLTALLILWLLMVIWHVPNDIVQYRNGGYLLVRFALYPFITILFGWVYNRTRGSIWAVAVFHASMNSMNPIMGIFPMTTAGNVLLVFFALLVIVTDRMWRKLPGDHPAVYLEEAACGNVGRR